MFKRLIRLTLSLAMPPGLRTVIALLIIAVCIPGALSTGLADQGLILTVGPGGNHPTIQAAVNAAIGSLGSSPIEIRVATGAYAENIVIPPDMNHGSLLLTGGWNADFTSRDGNPALTVVDGGAQGRVFEIRSSGGALTIDGFTVKNGASDFGAGMLIFPRDTKVTVNNNYVQNNAAGHDNNYNVFGGGIFARLRLSPSSQLVITNNLISENRCVNPAPASPRLTFGAGISIETGSSATFSIRNNVIENNIATGDGRNFGIGVSIAAYDSSSGDFSDNIVRRNVANLLSAPAQLAGQLGVGGNIDAFGTSTITVTRNQWLDNVNNTPLFSADVQAAALDSSQVYFTDSVVAGASGVGMRAEALSTGILCLTNLTIADNRETGLFLWEGETPSLYNSIIFNNGTNLNIGAADAGNNLIGVDPKFVNSAGREYHLLATSPAINAGTSNPPGGLGSFDLYRHARIAGGAVDVGACELGEPDFSLSFDQPMVVGTRGTKARVTVNINRFGGLSGNITITPPDLSAIGVKAKPPYPISTPDSSVKLKLKIKASASTGAHQITFTGRDESGREHSNTFTLVIQ